MMKREYAGDRVTIRLLQSHYIKVYLEMFSVTVQIIVYASSRESERCYVQQ